MHYKLSGEVRMYLLINASTFERVKPYSKAQIFIDSECVKLMEKYTPRKSGTLIKSATLHTKFGSGQVVQQTPYARKQYYENKGTGMRGKLWFQRMANAHFKEILEGAKELS